MLVAAVQTEIVAEIQWVVAAAQDNFVALLECRSEERSHWAVGTPYQNFEFVRKKFVGAASVTSTVQAVDSATLVTVDLFATYFEAGSLEIVEVEVRTKTVAKIQVQILIAVGLVD